MSKDPPIKVTSDTKIQVLLDPKYVSKKGGKYLLTFSEDEAEKLKDDIDRAMPEESY